MICVPTVYNIISIKRIIQTINDGFQVGVFILYLFN